MNKAILIGRLGQDPEIRQTNNGNVVNMSVATSDKKDGQEITEWHSVVCFGKTADNVAKYPKKGQQVGIEGKIQTRSWEKDGEKKYKTEIVAWAIEFLSPPAKTEQSAPPPQQQRRQRQANPHPNSYGPPPMDDDVSF